MKKTIGILGGMGPEAGVHMLELIIKNTKAEKDQDHIPVILYSNPKIPPRTDAILKKGSDPTPQLIEGFKLLKHAGADFIIMPCVTAHYFYNRIKEEIDFPFLNILDEILKWTNENFPELKKAGLISSTGTIKSGLFHKSFSRAGVDIITPTYREQNAIMKAIFGKQGIKAGYRSGLAKDIIINTATKLIGRGAEVIIAGCTEIPLVLNQENITVPLIDPMKIIAEKSIREAGYELKEKKIQT